MILKGSNPIQVNMGFKTWLKSSVFFSLQLYIIIKMQQVKLVKRGLVWMNHYVSSSYF